MRSDALAGLKIIPDGSVNVCVTSPPYFGLRDYGMDEQIGLEETPEQFIAKLVEVFREVRRVLRDDGTLWVNMGDSYSGSGKGVWNVPDEQKSKFKETYRPSTNPVKAKTGLKPKDLIGVPWMLAFALRADGWYLRQDIIWSKPNPMPESVQDRCTKSHEYIFMLSKSPRYYYDADAIRTPAAESSIQRWNQAVEQQADSSRVPGKTNGPMKAVGGPQSDKQRGHSRRHAGFNQRWDAMNKEDQKAMGANKRSVWQVATRPFKEAHFATFPPDLIEPCILAGCPDMGIVLDPFMGAGTTAVVARQHGRNYIGFELNPDYIKIAERRLHREVGLFNFAG